MSNLLGVGEAAGSVMGSRELPAFDNSGADRQRANEDAYYRQLTAAGDNIMDAARAESALLSQDLSTSLIGASAGRNPFAAQQASLAGGRQRAATMLGATGLANDANIAAAKAVSERPTEGQLAQAEIAKYASDLNTYEQSANRSGYAPSHGEIFEWIVKMLPAMTTKEAYDHFAAKARYHQLLAAGFDQQIASRESGHGQVDLVNQPSFGRRLADAWAGGPITTGSEPMVEMGS